MNPIVPSRRDFLKGAAAAAAAGVVPMSVVKLAFADAFQNPNTLYTVTYRYAEGNKNGGSMVEGDTVKLKKEMQFNVQFSTRS